MKKYLTLVLVFLALLGCKETQYISKKHEIRQLVKTERVSKYSRASFFLLAGSYTKGERWTMQVNMYVKDEYGFNYVAINMDKLAINIDNSIDKPYLESIVEIGYWEDRDLNFQTKMANYSSDRHIRFVLHCPEKYLPEKLLPVEIGDNQ